MSNKINAISSVPAIQLIKKVLMTYYPNYSLAEYDDKQIVDLAYGYLIEDKSFVSKADLMTLTMAGIDINVHD